jgi:hypothetical protein
MHAGIEQDAVVVNLDEPRARANVRVGIQIGDVHGTIKSRRNAACHDEVLPALGQHK